MVSDESRLERPITFNEAADLDLLPEKARPAYSTWWRWWKKGINGVRLATVVVGGRRYTTASAVQNGLPKSPPPPTASPCPSARRQRESGTSRGPSASLAFSVRRSNRPTSAAARPALIPTDPPTRETPGRRHPAQASHHLGEALQ